mgnify:CR=1 FL=1
MQYVPARKGIHSYIQMTPSNIYDGKYVTSNSEIINKIKGVHAQKVKYFFFLIIQVMHQPELKDSLPDVPHNHAIFSQC